jgi:homoserine O-acetyltransferase
MMIFVTPERKGAWRAGDHPGQRQFATLFSKSPLNLESGELFGPLTLAYETWGELNPARSNAILLLHGFSGDSHAAGPISPGHPTAGWWDHLIGPGRPIDTDQFYLVCPNAFGSCHGSTGPASLDLNGRPFGSRFTSITIRDMVAAEKELAKQLGIDHWHSIIGGSMGGMRALEWAVTWPNSSDRLLLIATGAYATAEQISIHSTQIRAIKLDPNYRGGDFYENLDSPPLDGLSLARSIAEISYGCERQLDQAFRRRPEADNNPIAQGRYAVEAYLQQHSEVVARRLDANSYILLTKAMSHHDIGRNRGGHQEALGKITARTRVVSVSSDRLFPPRLQQEIAAGIRSGVTFTSIDSPHGHDGFLCEYSQLASILRQTLG